VYYSITTLFL